MKTNPAHKLSAHYGGIRQMAEALDLTYETARRWVENGIPLERALTVEQRSNKLVRAEHVLQYARQQQG